VITNPANPLDIPSLYDPFNKTLTFTGPYDFDNPGGRAGEMLYHGAPWIEFNIDVNTPPSEVHVVLKGAQGPRASAVTWEYVPSTLGIWTGHIVNNGLRSLVVDVYDNTAGVLDEVMHQRIRFASSDAYPTGEVDTIGVVMAAGHVYSITVTPTGPKGSSCTVQDMLKGPEPPVSIFYLAVDHMNVTVDASTSSDSDGTIVSYDWTFGDGGAASGITAHHSYVAPGTYSIMLTSMDNDGLTNSMTRLVYIIDVPPTAWFTYSTRGLIVNVNAFGSGDDYGIVSYVWDWGDGTTGTGMRATHTYATAKSVPTGSGYTPSGRSPPPPHAIFGFTYGPDGVTPLNGCVVVITNTRTGESITYDSTREFWDPNSNVYCVDLSELQLIVAPATTPWVFGDILHVTATNGTFTGSSDAPVTLNELGYDQIDVTLTDQAPVYRVFITLTVTDAIGQTSTVGRWVTLFP
jgi:WD40 repeat protein